jgi:tetratricopeptide (TPR) repeat protein
MRRTMTAAIVVGALGSFHALVSASGSGASMPSAPSSSMRTMTPEERAVEAYRSGDEHRIKGKKLEDEAATKQGADAQKTTAKARSEFEKSLKDFKTAAQLNPELFQAYNGMGFAYRKTGDYAKALEMYDQAIKMAPGFFAEAVEYRAEAYLALNRLEDARKAYLDLFAADRKQADLLLAAMKTWVASHRSDAGSVDPAAVSDLEKWIGEREGLAKQTRLMAVTSRPSGW